MKSNKIIRTALAFMVLISCSTKENEMENEVHNVNITEALLNPGEGKISDFAESVEYIALDSEKEHLLAQNPQFFINGNEIIAMAKQQLFVFDRATGKFIREIGHYGKDPGGYKKVVHTFPFDEEKQLVYTGGWVGDNYFRYNTSGEYFDKVVVHPKEIETDMNKNIFGEIITSIAPVNDTCFVGYVWNINGKQENKLILFNKNNARIKTFPQYKRFDYDINRDGISVFQWNVKYYQLNQQLHFFERFTDTIFTITPDTLLQRFVLHQGENENATATDYTKNKGNVAYSMIEGVFESERYLFFKTRVGKENFEKEFYYGFYDKKDGVTKISVGNVGVENDIDGFIPMKFISANQNNEVIGCLEAYEVKLWFAENRDKVASLSPKLQKLKDISESDNPVVMVAKLKN